ncbi:MAG: hypothetical protein ACREJM_12930 [Candidatus Saccharimonadales bacterium]
METQALDQHAARAAEASVGDSRDSSISAKPDEGSSLPTALRSSNTPCWDLDRLAGEAEWHSRRINDHAVAVASDYWHLGQVLEMARGNFKRGKWKPWLTAREISADRASDARALARAFASPDNFVGMSVENAVRAARAKLGKAAQAPAIGKLRRQLNRLRKSLRSALPKIEAARGRADLRSLLDSLVADAQQLRRACQATDSP